MGNAKDFTGKVVVVTGGASGIGRALAARFARAGATVVILDINEDAARRAAAELGASAWQCDVTDYDRCRVVVGQIRDRFGGIDIVIANAGITHIGLFADTEPEVLRRVMEVNFFGAVHVVKAALDSLRERCGTIVVTSSIAGLGPLAPRCGYSASKHALHGLFDTLRAELRPQRVHVMVVCPGFTDTAIERAALAGRGGRAQRRTVGTLAKPEDVADAVFRGVVARKRMLVLTAVGKLSYFLIRIAPGLYERLMARRML